MNKWQRIEAAIHGEPVDRVPISLWKHYHLQDRAPGQLAQRTLDLFRQFDFDLIKLTPSGLYPIQDWGATIRFGRDNDTAPVVAEPVIRAPEDWGRLSKLDPNQGVLRRELETIQRVAEGLEGAAPFLMTIFNPLTIAYKLVGARDSGERLFEYLRTTPRQLHAGLAVIRDTVIDYAQASLDAGASGFFFATQLARSDKLTRKEYEEFGQAYDLPVLEALRGKSRVTWLHVCGQNIFFDLFANYPVDIIHWAAGDTNPSLAEGRELTPRAIAGGLSLDTLWKGTAHEVEAGVRDVIAQAGKTGLVLAPDCVIRGPSPDTNLAAVRRAVEC